jgi:proline iminopeptidase
MRTQNKFKEGYIKNNNIKLYYKSFGQGDPVIIVHGGPGFDHIHMLPFKDLADQYKVIFYDQRTTGKSTGKPDSSSISTDHFIKDLEALRKKFKLDNITLIGHSWGAWLSMEYAIQYPMNLNKLILLSPSGNMSYLNEYFKNIQRKTDKQNKMKMEEIEASEGFKNRNPETIKKYFSISIKPFFHDSSKSRRLDLTMLERTAKNQSIVAGLLMREMMEKNILADLKSIKCPTLVLHGKSDPLPIIAPQLVKGNISNSKMIVLEEAGHFMFAEAPGETLREIRGFLNN